MFHTDHPRRNGHRHPGSTGGKRASPPRGTPSLVAYFALAYTITWSIWAPLVALEQGWIDWQVPRALYYLGSFGPATAAILVTAWRGRASEVQSLLQRLLRWRVPVGYYGFAVAGPLLFFAVAVLVERGTSGSWPDLSLLGRADYLPYLGPLPVLGLWLLTYGLGEETGWRGFALPRLQESLSAGTASVVLGGFWALWHLPAFFFRDTYQAMGIAGFPLFAALLVFTSVVFTWLYNGSRGSLLIVVLFHGVFNWLSTSEAGGGLAPTILSAPVVLWAFYVVRRHGKEDLAPARRQTVSDPR